MPVSPAASPNWRPVYDDEAEIDQRRAAYSATLDAQISDVQRLSKPQVLAFFLAYQGRNDGDLSTDSAASSAGS